MVYGSCNNHGDTMKPQFFIPHPFPVWAAACLAGAFAIHAPFADAAVQEAWFQSYNSGQGISLDRSVGVVVDRFGNVVVTSESESDFYTVKYSATDGHVVWQQRFNTPDSYEYPTAVAVDGRGNVVVTGHGPNASTVKYAAADGAVLWEQFVGDVSLQIEAMALDHRGNVLVAGNTFVAKYAATDGRLLWEQAYNGSATAVAADKRGDVLVTGNRETALTRPDYSTAKFSGKDGALIWERIYDGPGGGWDNAAALAVDGSGNVVVTGDSENADPATDFKSDYYTVKYASGDGAVLWEHRYNGAANLHDYARSIAVDRDDNVVVTGNSYSAIFYPDFYTAKYAAGNGALLWERFYTGVESRGGDAGAVAVDRRGNVVIAGATS